MRKLAAKVQKIAPNGAQAGDRLRDVPYKRRTVSRLAERRSESREENAFVRRAVGGRQHKAEGS
jgi:hypothetical protein